MFKYELSLGEIMDRITILKVKAQRLPRTWERLATAEKGGKLQQRIWVTAPELIRQLGPFEQRLLGIHSRLWDLENELRRTAAELSDVDEIDMDKWLELASPRIVDNPNYVLLRRYLQTSQEIRRCNSERHAVVRELDQLGADQSEPKFYEGQDDTTPATTVQERTAPDATAAG